MSILECIECLLCCSGFIFLVFMGESIEGLFLVNMPWPLELPSICEIRNFSEVFSNESHFLSGFLDIILLRCFLFISEKQSLKKPFCCVYNHPSSCSTFPRL